MGKDLSNESMLHVKKEKVEYLQFKKLLAYEDKISHAYTIKPFDFDKKNINQKQQLEELKRVLNLEKSCLIEQKQTHSNHIAVIKNQEETKKFYLDTDGVITNQKGTTLLLRYADCIPLYFWDPKIEVIANIHSGWKGTVQQIGIKAVQKMEEEFGCQVEDLICCIGPSIGKCHFEVQEDVVAIFREAFPDLMEKPEIMEKGQNKEGKKRYYIDTVKINQILLQEAGLKKENIIASQICTVCNSESFHSYRKEREASGRNAAILHLKGENHDTR